MQTALAWKLHVTLERVGTAMRAPGVDFIGPTTAPTASPATSIRGSPASEPLGQAGSWRVVQLTDPRLPTACVGR